MTPTTQTTPAANTVSPPKDREERKLKKVKIELVRNENFALWSGLLMVGTTSVVDNIPTACTNGRDEMYGRNFVRILPERQLAFVVLHETLHKACRHLTVWSGLHKKNPRLANAACDYVINLWLTEMDPTERWIEMPKTPDGKPMGLLDLRFKGMSAKQVFDILEKEQKDKGGQGGPGDPDGGECGEGGSAGGFDEHDWDGAKELTEEQKHELEREIDHAIRHGQIAEAKRVGKGSQNLPREVGDLLMPKIDWRDALREFVSTMCANKDTSSWRRVNRRFIGSGVYMPSLVGETIKHVVIGNDTSGSIGVAEHKRNMSETYVILDNIKPERVDVVYWDARVAGHETYGEGGLPLDSFLSSTKPVGGGGTDPTSMMRLMNEQKMKPDCIVMFTDGEIGDWGSDWPAPVLWVICNDYRDGIVAPNGKTVYVTSE